jgi:hypothetical protein
VGLSYIRVGYLRFPLYSIHQTHNRLRPEMPGAELSTRKQPSDAPARPNSFEAVTISATGPEAFHATMAAASEGSQHMH